LDDPVETFNLIFLVIVLAIVVVGAGGLVALLRRRPQPPVPPRPDGPVITRDEAASLADPETTDRGTPDGIPPESEEPAAGTITIERPESASSRLVRLRARLARSQSGLGRGLLALLSRDRLDDDTWEDIEDTLITADVGVTPTHELVERLRTRLRVEGGDGATVRSVLHDELLTLVDPSLDRRLGITGSGGKPGVVLVVGVNGTGKTTTVGKLARILVAEDKGVLLGAADTFRAAAAEQLTTWGQRVGVDVVSGPEGGDPASVAFEAVRQGVERPADVVIVDTAGRLQNKAGLMDELGKVKRVVEKQAPVTEVLLVLDATTGQNGLTQARVFSEVVDVTGIVLTKLDGSAKGGIVIAVQRELGVPVKLVGLGEGADDLAPFDPSGFVDALLGES
jgi:fused signal recognition particle receptor